MVNNFTSGMWNGMKVEFGKVYSNLNAFAFKPLQEAGDKKLRMIHWLKQNHIYTSLIKMERNQP